MAYPPAPQSFLDACTACTYSPTFSCFIDASGAHRFPAVSALTGAWGLATSGDTLDATTAAALHGATAITSGPTAGSFKSTDGTYHYLGQGRGVAVLEPSDPPPP